METGETSSSTGDAKTKEKVIDSYMY